MKVKNLAILLSCVVLLASCKGKSLFGKKKDKSEVTGWNYNDKNMGGFQVAKAKDQQTGPGLVFVQGGTFTMGQTDEDVMGDSPSCICSFLLHRPYGSSQYSLS